MCDLILVKFLLLFPLLISFLPKKAGEYALYDLRKTFIEAAERYGQVALGCPDPKKLENYRIQIQGLNLLPLNF